MVVGKIWLKVAFVLEKALNGLFQKSKIPNKLLKTTNPRKSTLSMHDDYIDGGLLGY